MTDVEKKYLEFLIDVYDRVLLRKPDKEATDYWISMLKNKTKTMNQVEEEIRNSDEGTNIRNFSHYSAEFWNHLYPVQKYINKLCTDNEHADFIDDILKRFKDYIPFEKVLIVGCGNGWVERRLADMNIAKYFDAFDISDEYLEEARSKKNTRNVNYFVDDINELNNLPDVKYDAIFNIAILHHAEKIENAVKKLSDVLKCGGLIFNYEYIGPAQNQYSDQHLKIMQKINESLPERLQNKNPLRPPIQNFRVEPTEAIHSDLVRPIIEKYFHIVFEREFNGGIAYQILWNNISLFKDQSDVEAQKSLEKLLQIELEYTTAKKVPVLFWYSVATLKFNSS